MAKGSNRKNYNNKRPSRAIEGAPVVPFGIEFAPDPRKPNRAPPLRAKTEAQGQFISSMIAAEIVFGVGPAGTGKTYCAGSWAAQELMDGRASQIILTRPNVEVGTRMGFLPGELEEKYEPYLAPFRQVMIERMGKGAYECALKNGKISPEPLGYMRGKTFTDAIVLLDEAQNTTIAEMKMFLTRIGENCTVIISGDPDQCDLNEPSGLIDALRRLDGFHESIRVVEFEEDDVVRSGIQRVILKAYRK